MRTCILTAFESELVLCSRRLPYYKALTILVQCHSMKIIISAQKMWKTLEHTIFQNISERINLRSIAQWPSSLCDRFRIKRNIPDCSGICCLLCSLYFYSSGRKKARVKIVIFKVGRGGMEREQWFSKLLIDGLLPLVRCSLRLPFTKMAHWIKTIL